MKLRMWVLSSMLLAACASAVQAAADVAEVEGKIKSAAAKVKSMRAKIRTTMKMDMGQMSMEGTGDGSIEFVRKGDKVLTRTELKTNMSRKMGEQEMKMDQNILAIVDGEYTYILNESMGQKMAVKTDIDAQFTADPAAMFDELHKANKFTSLPDDTVDGRKVWVLEAVANEAGPEGPAAKTRMSFDQDSGFITKIESLGEDGKPTTTIEYIGLQLDAPIDAERFVFKAPEGVEVLDQTKPKAATSQPASAPTSAPAPAPAKP